MRQPDSSRCPSQRRPRLLRASMTEPSLFTSSVVNHGSLDMSQPTTGAGSSGSNSSTNSYRRATDLLNHVAYLSSCATSQVASLASNPLFDRMIPHRPAHGTSGSSSSAVDSTGCSGNSSSGVTSSSSGSSGSTATSADTARRRSADDIFGSSPASTHTSGSLDELHGRHPCSANYYSFPSFDTWDPDRGDEKEDDVDG